MRRPKGQIRLGFDLRHAGMGSKEEVIAELNLGQAEWEKKNPGYTPTDIKDVFQRGGNCVIGGICFAGQRFFMPVRTSRTRDVKE